MISHLRALKEGKTIECPTYDYTVHNRSKETVVIEPRKVIIVEGILALEKRRTAQSYRYKKYLSRLMLMSVYCAGWCVM